MSSSLIRTITVGSGLSPDLLTFRREAEALAGSILRSYRRWGIAPRPEDVALARRDGRASGDYSAVVRLDIRFFGRRLTP